jgi:hypothetical protein
MKTFSKVLVAAFSTLVLATGGVALADGAHHDPSALVQRFDANKDGKLQVTELPARMQQHLAGADADKDGVLTPAEITAFRAQRAQARFAKLDANKDGAIEANEAGARWAHFSVADANKDGKVTFAELEAARAAGQLHHGHGGHGGHGRGHGRK